ncbi:MAG: amino acid ABC transporter ATP-binding protein [Pseudomonas sp.]|nr:amino acid ABC transporter ATP-binding protein [Pseudomonas sp.]
MIRFEGVHKWFGNFHVLRHIDLDVVSGERIVICGPSGSGKSTLVRCINQLETHQRGRIVVDGTELSDRLANIHLLRSEIGMVFQSYNLFPHMSVLDNLVVGQHRVRQLPKSEAESIAMQHLERVRIADQADKYPAQLSGGQQQRVAIARALCMKPKIMLFDEVTSSLDPEMVKEVLDVIVDLAREGMTMMVVTHEMGFAREVADRIVFMEEGCIVEENTPAAFFNRPGSAGGRFFLSQVLHYG